MTCFSSHSGEEIELDKTLEKSTEKKPLNRRSQIRKGFLFFLYDLGAKEFHDVPNGLLCGRREGHLQFQKDALLSRRHCQFTVIGNEIYVEDFGGVNPSKVNSVPIQSGRKRRLRLGDLVEIGAQRFLLMHQNQRPPGVLTDKKPDDRAARRKVDGSLTLQLLRETATTTLTRTLVRIDRSEFIRMKTRRFASRAAMIVGILGSTAALAAAAWVLLGRPGILG